MSDEHIHSISSLYEAAETAWRAFQPTHELWFRGHTCAAWKLQAAAHRGLIRSIESEQAMSFQFRRQARIRHPNCPADDDLAGWLALMQHYGLPTRLMDWTSSLLVAAFFALRDRADHHDCKDCQGDATIRALSPFAPNKHLVESDSMPVLGFGASSEYVTSLFNREPPPDKALAVVQPEFDLRMMLQQAAFTIHDMTQPLEENALRDKFLMRFTIPRDAKRELEHMLRMGGTRESHLFPDLEHLSHEIIREKTSDTINALADGPPRRTL